jgi:transcription antitermination factor NusG
MLSSQAVHPADIDPISSWTAVYTRHQHEKIVAQMLTAKGFEVFLPLYESMRRWRDRRKLLNLPLFPGYVFVRGAIERRLHVVTTPGIHMILCQGDKVAIIPEEEIQAIQKAVNSRSHVEPHPFLNCGESVRVIRGALSGVEGILVRKKNVFRLVLSVDLLSQAVAVEVDSADVEPLGNHALTGRQRLYPQLGRPLTDCTVPFNRNEWNLTGAAPEMPARAV